MPTLRRILKYMPAVVLGLLVVAWVVSWFAYTGRWTRFENRHLEVEVSISDGSFVFLYLPNISHTDPSCWFLIRNEVRSHETVVGTLSGRLYYAQTTEHAFGEVPIPLAITPCFPLAIGPFLSFRFRLWHYLAYTALIALEIAYYLRWQE
jgi:hypothetical protein